MKVASFILALCSLLCSGQELEPLEIYNQTPLAFGQVLPGSGTFTSGGRGNVTLIGGSSHGQWLIHGTPNQMVKVTVTLDEPLTHQHDEMKLIKLQAEPSMVKLDATGKATVHISAEIGCQENQEPGIYQGSYAVTIAYTLMTDI